MRDLLNLAATLIEATTLPSRPGPTRAMLVVVASCVVALSALGSAVSLVAALWIYAEPFLGEVGAPLLVAAVLALTTLIAGLILQGKSAAKPPAPRGPPGLGAVINGLQHGMRSHKRLILLGALLVGLAAGEGERR